MAGDTDDDIAIVTSIAGTIATIQYDDRRVETAALRDLVVVSDFGEPIYPGFERLESITNGGNGPPHVVINGENFHVLEALTFSHEGRIDCIYIDPPYNSGARDWKYDNNYVDVDDNYRHSKWLAFMQRRLRMAKTLLNPEDAVLIVTIDEKEYLRLGMLLEQLFPEALIQMVSTAINPAVVARAGSFGRSDEYIFFVMVGAASPKRVRLSREWVSARGRTHTGNVRWDLLRRSGPNAARRDRPGLFYPIYIDPDGPKIAAVGDPLPLGQHEPEPMVGAIALLPIRKDGSEGNWQAQPSTLRSRIEQGRVRVTGNPTKGFTISVLKTGEYQKITNGEYEILNRRLDGSLVVADSDSEDVVAVPSTQWKISSHDATQYGSRLLAAMLPGRRFPFPKSLYAVEDALRFFLVDKPDATVLDFFGGSGTTTHAVMRLNHQDGGHRRSILITNNEVSIDEARGLRAAGYRPGDQNWESLGIFEYITKPRVLAALLGSTPEGEPLKGSYKFTDEFTMSTGFPESVEFMKLVYLDPIEVELDRAFQLIAPLLWLRASGTGPILETCLDDDGHPLPFACTDRYAILFDTDHWRAFVRAVPATASVAYVVTDSTATFAGIAENLPRRVEVVRLYENYLATFASGSKH
ncbi:MAG: Modification methylase KpnI [Ilumatobacteraceae bacterium]|nr:Modification methylase KpnI [Ilumatobacteraceae bacterium]